MILNPDLQGPENNEAEQSEKGWPGKKLPVG